MISGTTAIEPGMARRTDGPDGGTEEAFFLPVGDGEIFVRTHLAASSSPLSGALLICSPFGYAFGRGSRREVMLARQAARDGFNVVRFHYRGAGEGHGNYADMTSDTMLEDARAACNVLQSISRGADITILGVQGGSQAAAEVAVETEGSSLILWDPVLSGRDLFKQMFQAIWALNLSRNSDGKYSRKAIAQEFEKTGLLNVAGNSVGYEFYRQAQIRPPLADLPIENRHILLMPFSSRGTRKRQIDDLQITLEQRGNSVSVQGVPKRESWWVEADNFFEQEEVRELNRSVLKLTADWLNERKREVPARDAREEASNRVRLTASTSPVSETPVFFKAGDEELFGVLTSPCSKSSNGKGVLLVKGAGYGPSADRNGVLMTLGKKLAERGFHAFRYQFHGTGDSTGVVEEFNMADPFVEDMHGALEWMRSNNIEPAYIVGTCFGARAALKTASGYGSLKGLSLNSLSPRDSVMGHSIPQKLAEDLTLPAYIQRAVRLSTIKSLMSQRRRKLYWKIFRAKFRKVIGRDSRKNAPDPPWLGENLVEEIESALTNGVGLQLIYGRSDTAFRDFRRTRDGDLGKLLSQHTDRVSTDVFEGDLHSNVNLNAQEFMVQQTCDWIFSVDRGS